MGHSVAGFSAFLAWPWSSGVMIAATRTMTRPVRMELICQTLGGPSNRCTIAIGDQDEAQLSHWPDRSQLKYDHGNRDPGDAVGPPAHASRGRHVHVPFEPHAHEKSGEGRARSDGPRQPALRRGT